MHILESSIQIVSDRNGHTTYNLDEDPPPLLNDRTLIVDILYIYTFIKSQNCLPFFRSFICILDF